MFRDFIDQLRCPMCDKDLKISRVDQEADEIIEGVLACCNDHEWRIHEGVLDFNSEEQTQGNNWTDMYKDYGYLELDDHIMSQVPEVQKKGYYVAFDYMMDQVARGGHKTILDIATGRGMLLTQLVKKRGADLSYVCVDLSHTVLKYDRLKCLMIDPQVRINYIACDATNLPLKADAVDLSVSYCGIQNMGSYAPAGIEEGQRVARAGLINLGVTLADDNPKLPGLEQMIKDQGFDFDLRAATNSGFMAQHQSNKNLVDMVHVYEGIGVESDQDLIPVGGEWFALTAVHARDKEDA